MKKLIYSLSLIIGLNAYSYEISEETAIAKLEEFFYLLDVDRYEKDDFFKVTTEDSIVNRATHGVTSLYDKFLQARVSLIKVLNDI